MVVQDKELSILRVKLWYLSLIDYFLVHIRKAGLDLNCTYACSFPSSCSLPSSCSPTNSARKKHDTLEMSCFLNLLLGTFS